MSSSGGRKRRRTDHRDNLQPNKRLAAAAMSAVQTSSSLPLPPATSSTNGKKRRRPNHHHLPPYKRVATAEDTSPPPLLLPTSSSCPSPVLVEDLPSGCTVLELKSRLETYGSISRIRVDGSSGVVTFRSHDSALAAATAADVPHGGICVRSHRVRISLVANSAFGGSPTSKLLRAVLPLSKHGRSNKKLNVSNAIPQQIQTEDLLKGREIIAYDDLL